ncbi:MAG TPA: TIGR02556 family CRISPR-associated protein, partial [Thermodesulfobacteriota bacterium]
MIQAIKELGEQNLEREGRDTSDLLSILVQDPNQDGSCPKILVIVFKKTNDVYQYSHIAIEEASKSKIKKYLYRRGASKGPDFTPTAKITGIEKAFNNKMKGWFKSIKTKDDPIVLALKVAFEKSENTILYDLSNKWNEIKPSLQPKQSGVITLAVEENNDLRYVGDFQPFKDLLVYSVKEKYNKIVKTDHNCAVCGEKKNEVYGEAIPIPFYTLDKPGYVAGGFNKKDAWKNAPICLECSLKIEEGNRFLDETKTLSPKMGGQNYYLIPKFIFSTKESGEIIETFFKMSTRPDETLQGKSLKRISEDENEILEELGELQDVLTYNFLFFKTPNPQVFKINLLVEDVLPSRISTIFEAKGEVEKHLIFKDVEIKKKKYPNIEYRFDGLRKFTPSQKEFLEIVDKTFRGINLESNILFSWFMKPIRQGFINQSCLKPLVLQAFVSLLFFKKLGIIPQEKPFTKGDKLMTELKEKAEGFLEGFAETFRTPAHKVVFLLGVLTQELLDIQKRERKATPFRKYLRGLRMQEEDLKSLLPKIQNKLEEYGENYYRYRLLESLISAYFLESGRGWRISTDELNFYFVLGMNLKNEVDKALGLKKEK